MHHPYQVAINGNFCYPQGKHLLPLRVTVFSLKGNFYYCLLFVALGIAVFILANICIYANSYIIAFRKELYCQLSCLLLHRW